MTVNGNVTAKACEASQKPVSQTNLETLDTPVIAVTPLGEDVRKGKRGPVRQTREAREKIAAGVRRYYADPTNRRRRSDAAKAGWARRKAELEAMRKRLAELEAKAQA